MPTPEHAAARPEQTPEASRGHDTQSPLYLDPDATVDARVADLLARMTLREKVGQLNQRMYGWDAYRRTPDGFELTEALYAETERFAGLGALYGLLRADAWSGRRPLHRSGRGRRRRARRPGAAPCHRTQPPRHPGASRRGGPARPHGTGRHGPAGQPRRRSHLGPRAVRAAPPPMPRPNCGPVAAMSPSSPPSTSRATPAGAVPRSASARTRIWPPASPRRWCGACRERPGCADGQFAEDKAAVVLKHFAGQGATVGGRNSAESELGPRELHEIHLPAALRRDPRGSSRRHGRLQRGRRRSPAPGTSALLDGAAAPPLGLRGAGHGGRPGRRPAGPDHRRHGLRGRPGTRLGCRPQPLGRRLHAPGRGASSVDSSRRTCSTRPSPGCCVSKFRLGLFERPCVADRLTAPSPDRGRELSTALARGAVTLLHDDGGVLPVRPTVSRIAVLGPHVRHRRPPTGRLHGPAASPAPAPVSSTGCGGSPRPAWTSGTPAAARSPATTSRASPRPSPQAGRLRPCRARAGRQQRTYARDRLRRQRRGPRRRVRDDLRRGRRPRRAAARQGPTRPAGRRRGDRYPHGRRPGAGPPACRPRGGGAAPAALLTAWYPGPWGGDATRRGAPRPRRAARPAARLGPALGRPTPRVLQPQGHRVRRLRGRKCRARSTPSDTDCRTRASSTGRRACPGAPSRSTSPTRADGTAGRSPSSTSVGCGRRSGRARSNCAPSRPSASRRGSHAPVGISARRRPARAGRRRLGDGRTARHRGDPRRAIVAGRTERRTGSAAYRGLTTARQSFTAPDETPL